MLSGSALKGKCQKQTFRIARVMSALRSKTKPVIRAAATREPILLERGPGALLRYQVRVGAESREAANDICKKIHLAGGDCVVLRNPGS